MISSACGTEKGCRMDVLLLGLVQLLTAPLLFIGWVWSINHGVNIHDKSKPEGDGERGGGVENTMTAKALIKHSCAKLMYELVGTGLWTLLFMTSKDSKVLFFGLWILNAFMIRVSGAHFNPAVSFAYAIRADDKGISRKLSLAYIVA